MRFSLPTYLSDLLNVIGCDYVQARLPLKLQLKSTKNGNVGRSWFVFHECLILKESMIYSQCFKCVKRKHTIFGKKTHKPPHLWCPNPTWKNACLLSLKTLQYRQFADLLLLTPFIPSSKEVRGCRWPFLCNLPPSFRSLMVWKDDNWCHIRLCFYEINGILGNERQKKSTTNGDVRWKWVFGMVNARLNIFWDIERMM